MENYCLIRYEPGRSVPEHLQQVFRLKGYAFEAGERVEVPAKVAGLAVRSAPPGSINVLEGEPEFEATENASVKEKRRRLEEQQRQFPVDPAAALEGVEPLPKEILEALEKEGILKFIAEGGADARLADTALFAALGGRLAVARACARRAAGDTRE